MSDEKVVPGEEVITSGGDRIFPKGLPVGRVVSSEPGKDLFLNIRVIPSARLDQLEEVLVVTRITEKMPDAKDLGPLARPTFSPSACRPFPTRLKLTPPVMPSRGALLPRNRAGGNWNDRRQCRSSWGSGRWKQQARRWHYDTVTKPGAAVAPPRATQPGASTETNGTVKPKATNPPSGRSAGAVTKPLNSNAAPAVSPQASESAAQDNGETSPPAKKQRKPAADSTPNAPSEQPSSPPAGAPPQP